MQIDVPVKRGHHGHDAMEVGHVGYAAEMAHEVEAAAAETAVVQFEKAAFGDGTVDIGHGTEGSVADGDGVQRDAVIDPVNAGIDNHGAPDAELAMQRTKIFERRVRRCIGTARRIGIFVAGAEDVGMRVTGQRG